MNLPFQRRRSPYVPDLTENGEVAGSVARHQGPLRRARPITAVPFHLVSGASNNATLIQPNASWVICIWATNVNAAIRFLKLYDLNVTPVPAAHVPSWVCGLPGNTAGAGGTLAVPEGLTFATGLGIAIVAGSADNDSTAVAAGEIVVSIGYRYATDAISPD